MEEVKYQINESTLTAIADSIRTKTGGTDPILTEDMAGEIDGIETGITPSGTVNITANGTYDVTEKAEVSVAVPIPEGYVKPSGTQTVTANGTYNVTSKASVVVAIPTYDGTVVIS